MNTGLTSMCGLKSIRGSFVVVIVGDTAEEITVLFVDEPDECSPGSNSLFFFGLSRRVSAITKTTATSHANTSATLGSSPQMGA